jgi:DNA primase
MQISERIKQIDLSRVVTDSGVTLNVRGRSARGLCPFHDEKTPSFFVFPDNHFKCFGCGEHGDAVDFIQKLTGCDFNHALGELGIRRHKQSSAEIRRAVEKSRRRMQERKRLQQRESNLAYTLSLLIRTTRQVIGNIQTVEDLEQYAELIHALPFWKHCHDILISGNRGGIAEVIEALQDMVTVDRGIDFKF